MDTWVGLKATDKDEKRLWGKRAGVERKGCHKRQRQISEMISSMTGSTASWSPAVSSKQMVYSKSHSGFPTTPPTTHQIWNQTQADSNYGLLSPNNVFTYQLLTLRKWRSRLEQFFPEQLLHLLPLAVLPGAFFFFPSKWLFTSTGKYRKAHLSKQNPWYHA